MHLKPRPILAALSLALAPFVASAQDVELITEARVTFEITFGTSVTTTNGQAGENRVDTTRGYLSTITNRQILESLRDQGFITTADVSNWTFVAVRPAPGDVDFVDSEFVLYAVEIVNNQIQPETRVRVPGDIFNITRAFSARTYTETYQGRNVITSRGTVVNYADVSFTPTFVRTQVPPVSVTAPGGARTVTTVATAFTLDSLVSSGFSTITYATRSHPIFYYPIETIRFTSRGDFTGTLVDRTTVRNFPPGSNTPNNPNDPPVLSNPYNGAGLVSIRITVQPARLVPQTDYPDVPFTHVNSLY
jgi:hypothetical protein